MRDLMKVRALAWLAALELALASSPARAQQVEGTRVEVRCSALLTDPEAAAALEARVILELSLRKRRGALRVECDPETISLEWQPRSQGQRQRVTLPLAPASNAADRVISSLDVLLAEPKKPEPPPAAPAPPLPPSSPPAAEPPSTQIGVTSGGIVELWDGPRATSLGLSLGLSLRGGRWRGTLAASAQKRIEDFQPIVEFRAYRARFAIDYALLPEPLTIEAGSGVALGNFQATARGGFTPPTHDAFALALIYRLRAAWHSEHVTLALGPELAVNVIRPTIVLESAELSGLTPLSWGATGDVYFWF
jgi:hypothetical protein